MPEQPQIFLGCSGILYLFHPVRVDFRQKQTETGKTKTY